MLKTPGSTFRPVQRKNSAAERKKISPRNFHFLKASGLKKKYLCLCNWEKYNFSWTFQESERIRRGKQTYLKFDPISAVSVQNLPKFGWRFLRPLHFFYFSFALFLVMRPKKRPFGNTADILYSLFCHLTRRGGRAGA